MKAYPDQIKKLIAEFKKLPGVGPKTAERYCFDILRSDNSRVKNLVHALAGIHNAIRPCKECHVYADADVCSICSDPERAADTLCIVASHQDLVALENSGSFSGKYHVLGGVLNALDGRTPDQLTISSLVQRIKDNNVSEVILALSPDIDGEVTMTYLTRVLKQMGVHITRLAQGLPMGSTVEYADEVTLRNAFRDRRHV